MTAHWLEMIDRAAGDAVALVDDTQQLTYADLRTQSGQVARWLGEQLGGIGVLGVPLIGLGACEEDILLQVVVGRVAVLGNGQRGLRCDGCRR